MIRTGESEVRWWDILAEPAHNITGIVSGITAFGPSVHSTKEVWQALADGLVTST